MAVTKKTKLRIHKRQLLIFVILLLALYGIIPQFSNFHKSWTLLTQANISWLVLAEFLTLSTFFFAAITYYVLAVRKLKYSQVVIIQFAATLLNRLLPAGVGALGANYAYLRHQKHNPTQAATVVGVNNIAGILGHGILVIIALLISSSQARKLAIHSEHTLTLHIWLFFGLAICAVFIVIYIVARDRLVRNISIFKKQIKLYRSHPSRPLIALLSSMCLTLANMLCLYASARSLAVHLPLIVIMLVFTLGISAGTATPTPGGLGGFEAGLFAGFIAFHVSAPIALAIALLYRLIITIIVFLIGLLAFIYVQRNKLLDVT